MFSAAGEIFWGLAPGTLLCSRRGMVTSLGRSSEVALAVLTPEPIPERVVDVVWELVQQIGRAHV